MLPIQSQLALRAWLARMNVSHEDRVIGIYRQHNQTQNLNRDG